jgi:hypothetical protein
MKTLKDFSVDACSIDSFSVADTEELKQEAIKQIKEHRSCDDKDKHKCDVCAWIEEFFNITEEDLK